MSVSNKAEPVSITTANDFQAYFTRLIQQAIATYLTQEQIAFEAVQLPIDLRFSAQSSFGDYSVPVMRWAGKNVLGRPPLQIAESLAAILNGMHVAILQEVTATKPGYVNFRLNRAAVGQMIINRVLEEGPDFGQSAVGAGTRVVLEHTSINSNKAAHVGHLRNSCLGDTVVRMLRSQGYSVEAENYIDDSGVQVADVAVGFTLLQRGELQIPGGNHQLEGESFDYYCSRVYVAVGKLYEEQPAYKELRRTVLHAIEEREEPASGPDYPTIAADISHQIVLAHLKTMSRLNISYDLLTWESAILGAGLWKRTFDMLRDQNLLENPQTGPAAGCWLLPFGDSDAAQEGDENERMQDKILVRSDGTATYTAKDISNQLWKFGLTDGIGVDFHYVPWGVQHDGRKLWTMRTPGNAALRNDTEEGAASRFGHASMVINVIDVRQSYTQQVVYESLRRLGYVAQADNSHHIGYEVVTLSRATAESLGIDTSDGRSNYAMSGRKGIEIKADDLINAAVKRMKEIRPDQSEEISAILAASAIRYFMIRFGLQQIIALDMDEVLRPNGDTGVYLQYAYARANNIPRRLQENGYSMPSELKQLPDQLEQSEWELLRHIDVYQRRLTEATEQLAPHLFANYAYDLAAHFSDFYEHTTPIVKETDETVKAFRAYLVQATIQTMNNVLRTLGFEPQERI
jgi:arginyl-tRNA synthetase